MSLVASLRPRTGRRQTLSLRSWPWLVVDLDRREIFSSEGVGEEVGKRVGESIRQSDSHVTQ
jgi:hypothetical protein